MNKFVEEKEGSFKTPHFLFEGGAVLGGLDCNAKAINEL